MANTKDVATFSSRKFEETVREMRTRRESVHDAGERVYRETGKLHATVNIHGKNRVSRNSMAPQGGQFLLPNGIALPICSKFDGTGSMAENVEKAFNAIPAIDTMLSGIRHRYNPQISSAVVQDINDSHPVFQMAQFESDNRIAEQMRLLVPDRSGGDAPEDYDIGLVYLQNHVQTDIYDHYGLKGYAFVVGDQIGRGSVSSSTFERHTGHKLQSTVSTAEVCRNLLDRWHLFYVQVGSGGGARRNGATDWWLERMGRGRVVLVSNPDLLAETQAGLIYVTETLQPTRDGFVDFVRSGGENKRVTVSEASQIWDWLVEAKVPFGAQAKLAGYNDIPLPGAVFDHYRHAWPVGHAKAEGQATPDDGGASAPKPKSGFDWGKF